MSSNTTNQDDRVFHDEGLTRKLGLSTAIAIGIGTTVGSGIFTSIGEIAGASGSALFIALSFLLGGLYQIPASMFYAEIYSAYPVSGGVYKTFELAGWRPLAFISGWLTFVASDPPGLSVMALSIASYLSYFTHHSPLVGKFIAVAFILLFMFIHIRSVEGGGKLLDIITTFKIIPFVILAGVAICFARGDLLAAPAAPGAPVGIAALIAGISATTWSYDGTSQVVVCAGEIKNPRKNMPIALILTVVIITVFYTVFATAMAGLLPVAELAAAEAPVSAKFGEIHPKYKTPAFSIVVQCALAIFFIFASNISEILGYFTLTISLRSIIGYLVVFKYHKRDDYHPTYHMPCWRVLSIALAIMAFIMFLGTLSWAPKASWAFIAIALVTGYIGYRYFESHYGLKVKSETKQDFGDKE